MSSHASLARRVARTLAPAALLTFAAAAAHAQSVQASYPLLTDENDATGNYGPITLSGNPAPVPNNGVCMDGVYAFAGGTDAQTPTITTFDEFDFELSLDFNITSMGPFNRPIWVGGNGWRFIGFYYQTDGTFGILYNNANYSWSSTVLQTGVWYSSVLKFENGDFELYLDGNLVHSGTLGALNTGNNYRFTPNNFSNGTNFDGCIRNLVIANDTTLGPLGPGPIGSSYCGPAAANSTGSSAEISAFGSSEAAANDVTLTASNVPPMQFGIFLTSETQAATSVASGTLCLGGNIIRFQGPGQVLQASAGGEFSLQIDTAALPAGVPTPITAGDTYNFTAWFRDVDPMVGNTANFTDGVSITFN